MNKVKKMMTISMILLFLAGDFSLNRFSFIQFEFKAAWIFLYLTILFFLAIKERNVSSPSKKNNLFMVFSIVFISVQMICVYNYFSQDVYNLEINSLIILISIFLLNLNFKLYYANYDELLSVVCKTFIIVSIVYSIIIFYTAYATGGRGSIVIGGPNVTTRIVFFGLICSLYLYSIKNKIFYLILVLVFFASIILVGSRGGIVSAIISIIMLIFIKLFNLEVTPIKNKKIYKSVLGIIIGIAMIYPLKDNIKNMFTERIVNLLIKNFYLAGRDELLSKSLYYISKRPIIGYGFGSYYQILGEYPHNIILEIMLNTGVLGLLLFIPVVAFMIYIIFKGLKSKYYIFYVLPFYMFMVSNFSGNLYDFRFYFFWVSFSLFLLVDNNIKKTG